MKNPFRYMGEGLAYFQAFLDDTILYTVKQLQAKADKETDPKEIKKIHKKMGFYISKGLSKSIGESFSGFYEKYAELKKGENLAQNTIEKDLPRIRLKAKNIKLKMQMRGIKKGDLEGLKKLKD